MSTRGWILFLWALGGFVWMINDPVIPPWLVGVFIGVSLRGMYELGCQSKEKEE